MSVKSDLSVRGVVLAGVHQWEATTFETALPRPLMPVANWPLICYSLNWLKSGGIREATICANSTSRQIRECLGNGRDLGMSLEYFEDGMPRGPAGCVRDAVEEDDSDIVVAVDGTLLPSVNLSLLIDAHIESGAPVTVAVAPERREGQILEDHLTPVGIYVFQKAILQHVEEVGYRDIKEGLIPKLYSHGKEVLPALTEGGCYRVSSPSTYMMANAMAVRHLHASNPSPSGYLRIQDALVHATSRVPESARLVGPVLVGPGSVIGEKSTIVGPTVIGQGCCIGFEAVVSGSVLWNHCELGDRSVTHKCVLTDDVHIDKGAHVAFAVRVSPRQTEGSMLRGLRSRLKNQWNRASEGEGLRPTMRIGINTR